ncbi:hypothetical protein IEZ26_20010 [Nocardioides cavernae]|uniref:Uncharacterized protein n=1 Tax=Nocardioides cavernae TaxID=1921566 RepID=A0ABR8NFM0_9ACTN|nr:hypothetical protein [Nocardioides cavernae]MBD3926915.1 hypothetical protein [Nocardioides cavernae]MBM7512636.1 hypothetical protein [Nocardioides cavernae]
MGRSRKDEAPSRDLAAWRAHLSAIRPDADPSEADWWDTTWESGTPAAVGFLIPRGFEAYARVLHPARDREGRGVRWAAVAVESGTTLHPEAQWHRLAGGRDLDPRGAGPDPARWPGNEPMVGTLERPLFEALADVLASHTATPDPTFVAFWVGHGLWPRSWDDAPTTHRPARESYVFERPISEVVTLCAEAPAVGYALGTPTGTAIAFAEGTPSWIPTPDEQFESFAPHQWQSPSAWWPADHTWATSSDTDLDSTLVGGSRALVDDLLADERLEVLPWPVDGSLWAGADIVNA